LQGRIGRGGLIVAVIGESKQGRRGDLPRRRETSQPGRKKKRVKMDHRHGGEATFLEEKVGPFLSGGEEGGLLL